MLDLEGRDGKEGEEGLWPELGGQDTDTVRGDGVRGMWQGVPECPQNAEC